MSAYMAKPNPPAMQIAPLNGQVIESNWSVGGRVSAGRMNSGSARILSKDGPEDCGRFHHSSVGV